MNPFEQELKKRNPFEVEKAKRSGYVPIPGAIQPELAPEPSFFESMPKLEREAYVGAGATLGGLVGAGAGPFAPVGIAAGGTLGATAGSLVYDLTENLSALAKGEKPPRTDLPESMKQAGREAYEEALWGMGTMAAGPVLQRVGKPLVGRAMGVLSDEARRMTDLAHGLGVELGAAHVSKRKLAKGLPNVLGVFPFVGTPYRKGQARVVGQLDDAAADMLNTLAPVSTRYDVAKGLTKAAAKRYGKFNRVASALYDRFYKIADSLPVKDIVPTGPLKQELADVAQRKGAETIMLQSGEPFKSFRADPVGDWLRQIDEMGDFITVEQARGLERDLNAILRESGKQGWDVSRLGGMKEALQSAKGSLDVSRLSPDDASRVLGAWNNANEFFTQVGRFQTPTAKRFGRTQKNIFGKGIFKPGTVDQDQIFSSVYQAKSPEALSDLRSLVGPKEFQKATRKFLDNAFDAARVPAKEGAIVEDMFSAADFEKRLGLDTKEGWDALEEMLKGTNVTPQDWKNFLDVAKTATDITIRDPSTFVMRRMVLGGGLAGSIAMGAGKISVPAAAALTYAARKGAKFMMSPQQLRLMTRVLKSETPDHLRRTLLTRFIRLADREEPKAPGRPPTPRPTGIRI